MARRNILVVLTHDHGQWCVGAYGNDEVQTPTLDWLAETGIRMENGFCPSPICSPARGSFFTGLRPSQHGIHGPIYIGSEYDGPHWLADQTTLPELLGEAGYHTGLAGEWHCGRGLHQQIFDYTGNLHDEGLLRFENTATDGGGDVRYLGFALERDRHITDRALEFLRRERDTESPFFLFVGLTGTHPAGYAKSAPRRLVNQYRGSDFGDIPDDPVYRYGQRRVVPDDKDQALANYYAAAQGVDEQVGRLIDELEAQDILQETLVIYTADHGHNCNHHGLWKKGNSTHPLNMVEESIRVPYIINGHEELSDYQIRPEFIDHTDTFQTLLEFAGVGTPDRNYPGDSYLPQLIEAAGSTEREQIQICELQDVRMIRTDQYKLVRVHPDGPDLLFDLEADPRETRNVIDDPALEPVVDRLSERIEREFGTYSNPEKSGLPFEDIDPVGQGRLQ